VVLEVKWIDDGIVRTGGFCTAQGDTSISTVSLGRASDISSRCHAKPRAGRRGYDDHCEEFTRFTTPTLPIGGAPLQIITLHTFATIWYSQGVKSLAFASILVGVQWLFLILFIAISSSIHNAPSKPFYSPTPVRSCLLLYPT
jgi:hypothetical protein